MKKRAIKIGISFIFFLCALLIPFENIWINRGIFIISYFIVGFDIIKKAIRNIFRGKIFDENFLMAIATVGAFIIGEYPEAVAVMIFYQVGELFQSYAVDKSRKSISDLMDIKQDFANLQKNGEIIKVEPDEVKIGDIIIIKPGEKIPLDGVVIEGNSRLDTKALTGESVPKKVDIGDNVLSGCINTDGVLKIKVSKEYDESTVNKILELVENASTRKSKSENFITKFARFYTPIVVIIAILLAIIPIVISNGENYQEWIYRALSFLVVSCPCAIVISVPLSFFGGIGGASKKGILIKGSNYIEALSNVEIIVFDKTGTLTKGAFEVQDIKSIEIAEEELIFLAAHAESFSNHPIAKSIKDAYGKNINSDLISDVKEIPGQGISAIVNGKNILIGNEKLMQANSIKYKKEDCLGTVSYIAVNGTFSGTIVISDSIKKDAKDAINKLKPITKKLVMLTGDRKNISEEYAKKLDIEHVHSELMPEDKVEKIEELMKEKSKNGKLIFVGDGINDAPVIAISDIGFAMGALRTRSSNRSCRRCFNDR